MYCTRLFLRTHLADIGIGDPDPEVTRARGLVVLQVARVDEVDEGLGAQVAAAVHAGLDHVRVGHPVDEVHVVLVGRAAQLGCLLLLGYLLLLLLRLEGC